MPTKAARTGTVKGTVPFGEFRTWYRSTGELSPARTTLVAVHGGPGSTHDYLLNLSALTEQGVQVLWYDQIGNGGSTHLPDRGADFWTVDLFQDELDNLLWHLGVADNYVLFGHSWGGILAAAHAAGNPAGLRGLIVADAPASYPIWLAEMARLRSELPPGVDETLRRHEAAGTTNSSEYYAAVGAFNQRHLCRLDPWPREYQASFFETYNDPTVYFAMNGPSEFHVVGTLKDYSIIDSLPRITVPTLLVSGRHDEATPAVMQPYQDLIPDVRWEIFEESSHLPHLEEPERFRQVLADYLTDVLAREQR
jgi:L-proline amide hydrolase